MRDSTGSGDSPSSAPSSVPSSVPSSDVGPLDAPDIVDDGVTDVLAVDDQVAVPASVVEQVQSMDYDGSTFVSDVPDWDEPDAEGDIPLTGSGQG